MHSLYRLLTLLLTPLALIWLQRGSTGTRERRRWRERLGRLPAGECGRIWLHAASVGEINAAAGLIRALLARGEPVLISSMTRTGAERCRELFGAAVEHRYLSLDNPLAVSAWLKRTAPRVGLIVETEIWPELYRQCQRLEIPLLLVNARISAAALRRYQRFRGLVARALEGIMLAVCQTGTDAERLVRLGLPQARVRISGNLKFDFEQPAGIEQAARALRQAWGQRPVWVAGSTRPGEEAILIEAHAKVRKTLPDALLVLAPRHPERADAVARLLDASALAWCRCDDSPAAATAVVLIDRLGALLEHYAAADAAFVGASLVPLGGHNLLEPAALAKPVLAGPYLEQQTDAVRALSCGEGLIVVRDSAELTCALTGLLSDPQALKQLGAAAQAAMRSGSGSLERTLAALEPWFKRAESQDARSREG